MGLSNEFSCEAGSFSCCFLNPMVVFTQRFEALFPCAGTLGCEVCFAPPLFLQVYLHANVGPRDLLAASGSTACPICSTIRHLSGFASRQVAMSPICPVCPFPPLLLVWMNVSSLSPWLWDFHTVQFSVSSGGFLFLNCCPSFGCVRRHKCVYLHLHLGWKSPLFHF